MWISLIWSIDDIGLKAWLLENNQTNVIDVNVYYCKLQGWPNANTLSYNDDIDDMNVTVIYN